MSKKRNRSKQKQSRQKQPKRPYTAIIAVILIVVVGASILFWRRTAAPPLPADYATGTVLSCLRRPAFISELGLEQPSIDTSQTIAIGLIIREPFAGGRYYQHETWDDAGSVGPFAYDQSGTIYIGPAPLASVETNPTAEQNWIYAVDSETAVMTQYLELPWPKPPGGNNPFGITGLTYDCDSDSLYAASVAGSTGQEEVGGIYQIDLESNKIVSSFTAKDAVGIGIYNGVNGKRLYYGLARSPEIYSIGLNAETGHFWGEPRLEFSLAAQSGGSFDNAHRIQFTNDGTMIVKGVEFSYSLQVASDPQRNIYTFQYEPASDSWIFVDVVQEQSN